MSKLTKAGKIRKARDYIEEVLMENMPENAQITVSMTFVGAPKKVIEVEKIEEAKPAFDVEAARREMRAKYGELPSGKN